jgi:CRP-like cAMP-binding protein/Fe-S-cluster-containing hydrogenase component 2
VPLEPGSFFGEGSLISGRRRTATVVAGERCVLVKIPRRAMSRLVKSVPEVKRAIDEAFVLRKLQNTLAPSNATGDLQALAAASVVETFKPGEALFEEGAPPNGLHVIRRGAVSISVRGAGRERTLAYLPAGNVVGEMALFSPTGKRTATVRATTLTETIRVPLETIREYLQQHEDLASDLQELATHRLIENAHGIGERNTSDLVSFLMSAGAGEATDLLLIDESLCVRCDNCEKACADTHGGVSRLDREAGPTFASVHVPTSCRHCENPRCMTDCPPDALRRHPNGEVYVLDNCIGCGNCASFCPYGVIQMAAVDPSPRPGVLARLLFGAGSKPKAPPADAPKHAVKCDLCRDVKGLHDRPGHTACVSSCPTGAIVRVNPKKYVDQLLPR